MRAAYVRGNRIAVTGESEREGGDLSMRFARRATGEEKAKQKYLKKDHHETRRLIKGGDVYGDGRSHAEGR